MAARQPDFHIATDVVVFTVREAQLQVLLVRRTQAPYKGQWALPGGYLKPGEALEACARRELEEEAGVSGFYLEQLHTFGDVDRDPRRRVISVAYFALVRSDGPEWVSGRNAVSSSWHPVGSLHNLAFDHGHILEIARERLAARLEYSTIAFQLLPEHFTMREVHRVYELILGKSLDRRNFHKKMLASGDLVEVDGKRIDGAHRPASLYHLKKSKAARATR